MEQQNRLQKLFSLQFHDVQRQNIVRPHEIKIEKEDLAPNINDNQLLDRIRGSIIGMATGDALGAHVEFRPRSYLLANPVSELQGGGTWGLDKGQFTDDTSMSICLANSLLVCEDFEAYDQLLRYKWWYRYGYMSSTGHCFDIGAATRQSLQEFEKRQKQFALDRQMNVEDLEVFFNPDLLHDFDVNCSKQGVAGNGALMRLTPVPLFFFRNPIKAIEYSGRSAQITHGDQKAIDACRYYAALIIAALNGTNKHDLTKETFYEDHIQWFNDKPIHQDILNIAKGSYKKKDGYDEGIRGKGYVVDALEAALWAFWKHDDFEKGVLAAVNLGDDTDTTAAIYGQLAGIVYGFKGIPSKWTEQIYAKDFLLFLSDWIAFSGLNWSNKFCLINTDPINRNFQKHSHLPRTTSFILTSMKTPTTIEKKAMDSSGQIGFIYDLKLESFSQSDQIQVQWQDKQFHFPILNYFIKKGNENQCQNLLRLIGFDDEFRLNILSNLIQPKGIASLIDYPFVIDEYTRIIFYSSKTSQRELTSLKNFHKQTSINLITGIYLGIDLILILRLSPQSTTQIDHIFDQFNHCSFKNIHLLNNPLLNKILSIHVYSNIPNINEQKTIYEIFYYLSTIVNQPNYHWPTSYIIRSISHFECKQENVSIRYNSFPSTIILNMENILLKLASVHKIYTTIFHEKIHQDIRNELKDQLDEIDNRLNDFDKQFHQEKQRVKQYLIDSRQNSSSQNNPNGIFTKQQIQRFQTDIDDFIYRLSDIKKKQDFIQELKQQYAFTYWNILYHYFHEKDNFNGIQLKLINQYSNMIFICSNDILNLHNSSQLNQLLNQLKTSSKQLIYLDFSYSTYELNQITVVPLINSITNSSRSISNLSINTTRSQKSIHRDESINILLLGKSGVGKSTLINNFSNFIKFDDYEQMDPMKSTLDVIVSFLFSPTNDDRHSETHFICIGNDNQNEHFGISNQSTTQRCRLHNFTLKDKKQKMNFIDTPGFGKTNNQLDDDLTMQHILSRIINLTHLDAICIVIQPNETDLHCYRACLYTLFHCFGHQIQQKIFFIFNKILSFPIDEKIQLKLIDRLVESFKVQNIDFNKEKIISLDSTYFKQLSLWSYLRNYNNEQCKQSWQICKHGWNQLINSIKNSRQPFTIYQGLQNKQIYLVEINRLVRPIFETLRHFLRNQILNDKKSNSSIELIPIGNNRRSSICYLSEKRTYQCGPFWIVKDSQHEFDNNSNTCPYQSDQHFPTDYTIQFNYLQNQIDQQLNFSLDEYLSLILKLSYFIYNEKGDDPFLSYLEYMIRQEGFILTNINTNSLNTTLVKYLNLIKQNYQRKWSSRLKEKIDKNNLNIDEIIDRFKEIPLIDKQLKTSNILQETSV